VARADTVVFDKTGTLTEGQPSLDGPVSADALHLAASLAGASRHPLARALCRALPGVPVADAVEEIAGQGLRAGDVRLGSRRWCGIAEGEGAGPELWLTRPDHAPVRFAFRDQLRADAAAVVAALRGRGLELALLSGDRTPVVADVAQTLGIEHWQAGCTPADKAARLEQLAGEGRRVLMVGDGLNDAPALAGAYVSLSPASAADVSQTVADAVFQGDRLQPVLELLRVAGRADRLIRQNFSLALAYNVITIPLAIAGLVTPLVAALCMSASSLVVVGNALRLRIGAGR
jgi:Cu2+-exporting ATPase